MAISEENAHLPLLLKLSVYKCVGQNYVTYEEDLFAMFSRDEQERIIKAGGRIAKLENSSIE